MKEKRSPIIHEYWIGTNYPIPEASSAQTRIFTIAMAFVTYGVVTIASGHGFGPLGLVLIFGNPDAWWHVQVTGWIATGLWTISLFVANGSIRDSFSLGGTFLHIVSWAAALQTTEWMTVTLVTSVPFWIFNLYVPFKVLRRYIRFRLR